MHFLPIVPAGAQVIPEADQQKIEAASPAAAIVKPLKPRKLLIFDLNVNHGGHASMPTANQAFTLMGSMTGAFETVVSHDPQVFKRESLRLFDAVFFNNTVGNFFTDPELRLESMPHISKSIEFFNGVSMHVDQALDR